MAAGGNPSIGYTAWPAEQTWGSLRLHHPELELQACLTQALGTKHRSSYYVTTLTHWALFSAWQHNTLMRCCRNMYFILKCTSDQGVHPQQSLEISGHCTRWNSSSGFTKPPEGTFRKVKSHSGNKHRIVWWHQKKKMGMCQIRRMCILPYRREFLKLPALPPIPFYKNNTHRRTNQILRDRLP